MSTPEWLKVRAGLYKKGKWKAEKGRDGWLVSHGRRSLVIAPSLAKAEFWADTHTPDGEPDYLDKIAADFIYGPAYVTHGDHAADEVVRVLRQKRLDSSVVAIVEDQGPPYGYEKGDTYAIVVARIERENDA